MSDTEKQSGAGGAPLEEMLQTETGGRAPAGIEAKVLFLVPLAWSLFQVWIASPLPFLFHIGVFNSTEARSIHLAFALFLAFTAFPAFKRSPRDHIPAIDWLFALVGAFCASYLFMFYQELSNRPGLPTTLDLVTAVVGILLLLEATRRALGPPLMIVAMVFLFYTFAGPYMPDVISHHGASLSRTMSHQWLSTEGVFGVALGVSTSFVFLFVLFGAVLEQAGAGNYFIKVAFALLGHMRGGPAKAAVVSSGLTGVISGSSIANVVTTGTFTIPLMKRVGYPATKAGAVEVAASVNGQLMPPVMGAAAFLMVEYVGISYLEVIKHAILPAVIAYIALVYMVHLEAMKMDLQPLPNPHRPTFKVRLMWTVGTVVGVMLLSLGVYYGIGWTKAVFGAAATWMVGAAIIVVYVGLVKLAANAPPLEEDDPNNPDTTVPPTGPTVQAGLYYLLPVVVLIWCLMVERFSPGLSAFWALVFLMIIAATHRPMLAYFRRNGENLADEGRRGLVELVQGMVIGARNMIGIGVATAAAGIVVGTVTLTGIGLIMTEFVGWASSGLVGSVFSLFGLSTAAFPDFVASANLSVILFFTAFISLILGMGLPTTANYIVVSTLMAPVIVHLGAAHGLIVPLIAVHMFVFYFGILADDTPPVGLAAYAAAAISGADPIRTGVQGFIYDIRTAILPFMFIFNTQLLLIGLTGPLDLVVTVVSALAAMLIFAAATQGYWLTRTRWYETVALLLITFTLFRPGFWWDSFYPPHKMVPASRIESIAAQKPAGGQLPIHVTGTTIEGDEVDKTVLIPLGPRVEGARRLSNAGLALSHDGDTVKVDSVAYGSAAAKAGVDFGFHVTAVQVDVPRPPKELMFIPALALLGLIGWLQVRRRRRQHGEPLPQGA